jgi:hypothetical protein
MSESTQSWFVHERSRALAVVHLTRRDDLDIAKAAQDIGLEFMVTIKKAEEPSVRQFGVFLRGSKSATDEIHLNETLRPAIQSFVRAGEFPYPVCLFYFTMDDDQGYVTWVAEPSIMDGGPRLLVHDAPHCRKLDRAALGEIVEQVDGWYDAFFSRVAVRAS